MKTSQKVLAVLGIAVAVASSQANLPSGLSTIPAAADDTGIASRLPVRSQPSTGGDPAMVAPSQLTDGGLRFAYPPYDGVDGNGSALKRRQLLESQS